MDQEHKKPSESLSTRESVLKVWLSSVGARVVFFSVVFYRRCFLLLLLFSDVLLATFTTGGVCKALARDEDFSRITLTRDEVLYVAVIHHFDALICLRISDSDHPGLGDSIWPLRGA